ncbi:MAG: LysR family transcriptional regulator [Pigmentiphaga sp.]|uniref:LysR family transcriptional regulator n=1 Tax=Pigmentiphaga sp. TaxID=1977564 RepID=UPI0029B2B1CA|nr:LysR family transcriptional regulator [Pigmentiphaga sp.]MDX3907213.1 LysR family transcriptional regulator [Pigmentiphaga sp.]
MEENWGKGGDRPFPDYRQISIFTALYEVGSIARVAARLRMNASTVSMALARLRSIYQDDLFVRSVVGMIPTVKAESIYPGLKEAQQLLQASMLASDTFDPASATRHFRLASSEIGVYVLMPGVHALLASEAPGVSLEQIEITADTPWHLESGTLDLVVGHVPTMGKSVIRQRLYREHYVCLGRADHPALRAGMSVADFLRLPHLSVASRGRNRLRWEDYAAEKLGARPNIRLEQSSFAGIEHLLSDSDLVAVVPARLSRALQRFAPLMAVDLPFESPSYIVYQHWHSRHRKDAGATWLRKALARVAQA